MKIFERVGANPEDYRTCTECIHQTDFRHACKEWSTCIFPYWKTGKKGWWKYEKKVKNVYSRKNYERII